VKGTREEDGYSLVEVIVALFIFSIISVGFMSVMMSGARSTDATRSSVRLSEEARLGLNRIVRDVREAGWIALPSNEAGAVQTSFTVKTDYNGNGVYANSTGPYGTAESNYEVVTYAYDAATKSITVTADGFPAETLIKGVEPIGTTPVFSFTSNRLELDWNGDGVTTLTEVSENACTWGGNSATLDALCNTTLTDKEMAYVTNFALSVKVRSSDATSEYFAEAELRNRR
jgi:prepilin-type N-terminal cleavage/methylation domain-containing protein